MPDIAGCELILSLQLAVARAAQKDSLNWWEDDSLSQAGKYLLERLFLFDANEAGRKLALEAAKVRYQAAFGNEKGALHLFHLDQTGEIEHSLQAIHLSGIALCAEPIRTSEDLRQLLLEQVGSAPKYQVVGERSNSRLEIKLGEASLEFEPAQVAKTLAWASLEGAPGKPIFPFIQETA